MFDKLVESTKERKNGRTGRIFFLTGLVYAMLLATVAISTILGLNPGLAESLDVTKLAPPLPPGETLPQPVRPQLTRTPTTAPVNVIPLTPPPVAGPDVIALFKNRPAPIAQTGYRTCPNCVAGSSGIPNGVTDSAGEAPPPPPEAKPKPTPEATPEPKPVTKVLKVSSISPGLVLRRVSPQYPPMARSFRLAGAVQVQVLISEGGQVISTEVVSGHPILRASALEAARQWLFKPTMLNETPVKVQGVLTFNFTLN